MTGLSQVRSCYRQTPLVGLAREVDRDYRPGIILQAQDRNHANRRGVLLAADVLYEAVTRKRAEALPSLDSVAGNATDQDYLRQAAATVSARVPACEKARPRNGEGGPEG